MTTPVTMVVTTHHNTDTTRVVTEDVYVLLTPWLLGLLGAVRDYSIDLVSHRGEKHDSDGDPFHFNEILERYVDETKRTESDEKILAIVTDLGY